VTLPNNVPVNFDDNVELEPEFGHLPDTQKLVGCLLEAAAAAATCSNDEDNKDDYEDEDEDDDDKVHDITYFSASKWLEKNTPPVIDLTLLRGSDFSDDDEKENEQSKLRLRLRQRKRSGLHSGSYLQHSCTSSMIT
jgi:hypothetical protein